MNVLDRLACIQSRLVALREEAAADVLDPERYYPFGYGKLTAAVDVAVSDIEALRREIVAARERVLAFEGETA